MQLNPEDRTLMLHAEGNLIYLPCWKRIKYLSQNKGLHKSAIEKDSCGQDIHSNCHGTICFLLDLEKYVTGPKWEEHTYPINHSLKPGRPGYVDSHIMKNLLEAHGKQINNPKPGAIVTFWDWWNKPSGVKERTWLIHSAIYSQFLGGKNIIFHQRSLGKEFEVSTIEEITDNHDFEVRYHELS